MFETVATPPLIFRVAAFGLAASVHAALLWGLPAIRPLQPAGQGTAIEIALVTPAVPETESGPEAAAKETAALAQPSPDRSPEPAPPPLPEPLTAEEFPVADSPVPAVPAPQAPVVPNDRAEPLPTPMPAPRVQKKSVTPALRAQPAAKPKPVQTRAAPVERPARQNQFAANNDGRAPTAAPASPTGRAGASGNAVSPAAYAAQVRGILQARANRLGIDDVTGSVAVSFQIDSAGRVVSHAITRTSGVAEIDRAIRGMMGVVAFPPPPGGRFAANVMVRVQ